MKFIKDFKDELSMKLLNVWLWLLSLNLPPWHSAALMYKEKFRNQEEIIFYTGILSFGGEKARQVLGTVLQSTNDNGNNGARVLLEHPIAS